MNRYERLKELEAMKLRYEQFLETQKSTTTWCYRSIPHKRLPFFEQKPTTRRVSGIPQIIDIPEGLGFMEVIREALESDYKASARKGLRPYKRTYDGKRRNILQLWVCGHQLLFVA